MKVCPSCGAALPEPARFCPACSAPVEALHADREWKLATMVFADLVGSTQLAETQDPERTRILLERFYDTMAEEVRAAGGTVEKFAGDAVVAVFGAPAALEDHAERALHVALAMNRRMGQLFAGTLALRIGVNTGEVVVGAPREGSSFVTGDPVNITARLEQAADPGEVLVGERTVTITRGAFEFGDQLTIEAKGKSHDVPCRRLVRALSLMRPRGVASLATAFVGRSNELGELERAFAQVVEERRPQLVTVLGDAGVGKTRLLREFWDSLGGSWPTTVRRTGRCLSYGKGITYWPLAEVLKEHLGVLDSDPPAVILERLGSREILGLTLGLDVAQGLHPLTARDRFQDAWVAFLDELVTEQPTVMLIEDIHWAEEQLLDLLERIVAETSGPLLVIVTARPELLDQTPGWGAGVRGLRFPLEALSAQDAVQMLHGLLGASVPPEVTDVVSRAEGNPFFVEELVSTLIDRQLLDRTSGSWELAELPTDFRVPDTVQAVVAARIDLLDPAEKHALQAAAVIGRVFWAGPVYEIVDEVGPDLQVLEDRDFIRRRSGSTMAGEREYAIKHALTREVAYASVPRARRAHLHAAFAGWLEQKKEQGWDEAAPLLAHHYAEAVRPDDVDLAWVGDADELARLRARALHSLRRAAALAVGRFEIDDGLALLHRALELEPVDPERVQVWLEIGRANALKMDGEAFWAAMQQSLEGSDETTAASTYSELAFHTATRALMWKRRPDPRLVAEWLDEGLRLSQPESPARARALLAQVFADPDRSAEGAREASRLAERLDDDELRSWSLVADAMVAYGSGDFDGGYTFIQRAVDLLPRIPDPDHAAIIYWHAHYAGYASGRLDRARLDAETLDGLVATLNPHHQMHAVAALIDIEVAAGRWQHVRDLRSRVEAAVAANLETPCAVAGWSLLGTALANVRLGDETEARRLETSADDLGMEGYAFLFDIMHIEIAVARGDLVEVQRKLDEWQPDGPGDAEGLVAQLNALVALGRRPEIERVAPALVVPNSYVAAFALRALGVARDDNMLIEQAAQRFEAMGCLWHTAQTRRLLAPV